jgi:long-chain fatty acid transport protein
LFNAAGLSRLQGRQLEAGLNSILPTTDFSDAASADPFGGPIRGDGSDDSGEDALLPSGFYSHRVSEKLTLGLGIFAPYGLATEYDDRWVGRYHAIKSELTTLDINPALAYRVNPRLSIGAGLDAVYARAKLTNAVDFGSILSALADPRPAFGITPANPAADGFTKLKGDDWSWGWNLGLLYEFDADTRVGISYRSEVALTLDGDSRTRVPSNVVSASGGLLRPERVDISSDLDLPATLSLGVYHALHGPWALMAGAIWTDWSSFRETRVRFADGRRDFVERQDWKDTWRFSLGTEYRYSPALSLRAGVEYDQTPLRQATKRPRVSEDDLIWVAVGLSYAASQSLILDVAYSHVFADDHDIDIQEVTTPYLTEGALPGNRLVGNYRGNADIFTLGLRWVF